MSGPKYPELFPPALGSEEEGMLLTGRDEHNLDDPVGFVAHFKKYIPRDIRRTKGPAPFLQNGGLMYDGGAASDEAELYSENVNLERATPECATPSELATYIQASEMMYVEMLRSYVEARAKAGHPEMARAQRRTIDSYGNGRASHDSIESKDPRWLADFEKNTQARSIFLTYLQTRSFMTGAGYVTGDGAHFAQKVEHLTHLTEYGYVNSAYRNANENSTGPRIEIRCSDINILPWSIQTRVGGAALLFTMLQTPLVNQLANYVASDITDTAHVANFKRYNQVEFDPDGQIKPSPDNMRALYFQERIFELADEELGNFVDISDEYQQLLWEIRYYCEDFRKVLQGEIPLADLADRSDMAAKFDKVFKLQEKKRRLGIVGKLGDFVSMAADLRYDNITVKPGSDGKAKVTYGYGYKLRDGGEARLAIKTSDVEWAKYYPPNKTRAYVRGTLIRRGEVSKCDWSSLTHDGIDTVIKLHDVMLDPVESNKPGKL